MKKIFLIATILIITSTYLVAEQKCSDLPGYKKLGKDTAEYTDCLKKSAKFKLNTDSKLIDVIKSKKKSGNFKLNTDSDLTDMLTGKKKVKLPNPMNTLKKIANVIKPSYLKK
jgi:hypothetical protein